MGQKNTKGTVTIINASGRIRLRWRFKAIRHSISLGAHIVKFNSSTHNSP